MRPNVWPYDQPEQKRPDAATLDKSAPTLNGNALAERLKSLRDRLAHNEKINAAVNGGHSAALLADIETVELAIAAIREGGAPIAKESDK